MLPGETRTSASRPAFLHPIPGGSACAVPRASPVSISQKILPGKIEFPDCLSKCMVRNLRENKCKCGQDREAASNEYYCQDLAQYWSVCPGVYRLHCPGAGAGPEHGRQFAYGVGGDVPG